MKTVAARLVKPIVVALVLASFVPAIAGEKFMAPPPPPSKDWSLELASGYMWSNIRDADYDMQYVPIDLTASLAVDEVSLDHSIFRGYTEFLFRGQADVVTKGVEDWMIGLQVGPRYNFVQPGWRFVPFVEGVVGTYLVDANPVVYPNGTQDGLGQDFNFMFGVSAGFRYDITEDFFARFTVSYEHISNAGMSEPEFLNKPVDAIGPKLGFGFRF
jgi:opacity protein-like surface antigen